PRSGNQPRRPRDCHDRADAALSWTEGITPHSAAFHASYGCAGTAAVLRTTGIIPARTGVIPAARGRPSTRLIRPAGRACCVPLGPGPPAGTTCRSPVTRALPLLAVAYLVSFVRSLRLEYGKENTISGQRARCAKHRARPPCGARLRLSRPRAGSSRGQRREG